MRLRAFFFISFVGCFSLTAQEIHFDQIVKTNFSTSRFPNQEKTHFFNSNNKRYFAFTYERVDGKVLRIIDTEKQMMFNYFVQTTTAGAELLFLDKKEFPKEQKSYEYEFTELKSEDGFERLRLKIKGNGRRAKYNLSVEPSETDLFYIFKYTATESYYGTDFQTPFPLKVTEAEGFYNGGKVTYKLFSVESTDFSIILPDQ